MKRIAVLAILLALGCQPAKAPTATDVATTAIVLTDDALTVAIALQPVGFDQTVWDGRVMRLEQAADAVRNSRSLCPYVPALVAVAADIGCMKCLDAIKAIPCP